MIHIPITLEAVDDYGSQSVQVPTVLHYDSADPYAVVIAMTPKDRGPIEWVVARDLLADGLLGKAGEGDVLVRPCDDALEIALYVPEGEALLYADAGRVAAFLTLTYAAVPRGSEGLAVDIGGELDRLFGEAA